MSAAAEEPFMRRIVCSGLAGAIATTCIYPIDIVKTKLQVQKTVAGQKAQFSGPIDCVKKLVRSEGLAGIYRGWPPNVLLVMPEKALKLTMNAYFRDAFKDPANPTRSLSLGKEMLAGGLAGLCQVIATNPMELLKIQGATMRDKVASGKMAERVGYLQLSRQLGSSLYTGLHATLLRDIPFSMVYFAMYAKTREAMLRHAPERTGTVAFLAGTGAGIVAAGLTTPLDVIKTRVHNKATPTPFGGPLTYFRRENKLVVDTFRSVLAKEGAGAFFKGVVPRCVIISPLFAITMFSYVKLLELWPKDDD